MKRPFAINEIVTFMTVKPGRRSQTLSSRQGKVEQVAGVWISIRSRGICYEVHEKFVRHLDQPSVLTDIVLGAARNKGADNEKASGVSEVLPQSG